MAIAASVLYGSSTVLSGRAVVRHTPAALALWAQTIGLALVSTLAVVQRPQFAAVGVAWGMAAGGIGAVAVLLFYTALQHGRTSVVASISGCGIAVPVLVGLATGDSIGWRAVAGAGAALLGVVVVAAGSGEESSTPTPSAGPAHRSAVSTTPAPGRNQCFLLLDDGCVPRQDVSSTRSAVWLSIGAALGFGSFFVLLAGATSRAERGTSVVDAALVVSLAVQAGALAVTLVAATRHTRRCLRPSAGILRPPCSSAPWTSAETSSSRPPSRKRP